MGTRWTRVSVIRIRSKPVKWDDLRMEFISKCTADAIIKAAKALKYGHLVEFPTETVYGLGAEATNEKAISRIYSINVRPTDHPLIVHISSINKLDLWATDIPEYAIELARKFWPGPMTLILPRKALAKDFITRGQSNVGLRVPDQPIALALLKKFEELGGQGIAAPSANRFGAVSPTSADAVKEELGYFFESHDLVMDGGPCQIGIESTIIDCTGVDPKILRPGAVTYEMINSVTGHMAVLTNSVSTIRVPGMLKSHYSPKAKVEINSETKAGEGFIALSSVPTPEGALRLGSPETTEQFAREIYKLLRMGDSQGLSKISVVLPEDGDLSDAITDRMTKASAG
jgi:L-threonylcarbamoyladenylate synthase